MFGKEEQIDKKEEGVHPSLDLHQRLLLSGGSHGDGRWW